VPDCPGRNEAISTSRGAARPVLTPPRETTAGARKLCILPLRARQNARLNVIDAVGPDSAGTSGSGSGGTSGGSAGRTDADEHCDCNQGAPNDVAPGPFTNCDEACLNLLQIEVPDREETPNNMFAFDCYRRAALSI